MSSDGNVTGGGGANTVGVTNKPFFCYQCSRTVNITISPPSSDPTCPICNEGFLEEYDNPNPNQGSGFLNPNPNSIPFHDPFLTLSDPFASLLPLLFPSSSSTTTSSSASIDPNNPSLSGPTRSGRGDPFAFDPFTFIQNHLNDLRSSGAQIEFVIQNNPSDQGFRLPANIGDYFIGPGLEQLIQQLAENDPNRVQFAWTISRKGLKPSRCPVSIFIIRIAYCRGWNCIIRAPCVVTSCLLMILIMRGGFAGHKGPVEVMTVIIVGRGLMGIIGLSRGVLGYRCLGRFRLGDLDLHQVIMQRRGKKIWIENSQNVTTKCPHLFH
ncbi:E3 ubiquitin-protein ligase RING1 isoform X2 [Gossypium arboreum]|uniref:E3 ubiquitin-protein ligase RING1 isoform X2 n=1 Tax=Gossypium arboreum TaxID=29729 RepID=UPI0022F1548C|nr:E3 ubiquitin-protein ligase RING1 isoform X2 [Gossypium arboreum]